MQKTNHTKLRVEKVIKKKGDKLYVKCKGYDNSFNSWIDIYRYIFYKKSQYFPKPYECFSGNIKVQLNRSNYATKADLKGATGVDTSNLAAK